MLLYSSSIWSKTFFWNTCHMLMNKFCYKLHWIDQSTFHLVFFLNCLKVWNALTLVISFLSLKGTNHAYLPRRQLPDISSKNSYIIEANLFSYPSYFGLLPIWKVSSLEILLDGVLLVRYLHLDKPFHVENKFYQDHFCQQNLCLLSAQMFYLIFFYFLDFVIS